MSDNMDRALTRMKASSQIELEKLWLKHNAAKARSARKQPLFVFAQRAKARAIRKYLAHKVKMVTNPRYRMYHIEITKLAGEYLK